MMKKLVIILLLLVAVSASAQTTDSAGGSGKGNKTMQLHYNNARIIMVDGKRFNGDIARLDTNSIIDVRVLRSSASKIYGCGTGSDDVLVITTKQQKSKKKAMNKINQLKD
nr:hypothetical protein [Mucilaginibacter sp. L294]